MLAWKISKGRSASPDQVISGQRKAPQQALVWFSELEACSQHDGFEKRNSGSSGSARSAQKAEFKSGRRAAASVGLMGEDGRLSISAFWRSSSARGIRAVTNPEVLLLDEITAALDPVVHEVFAGSYGASRAGNDMQLCNSRDALCSSKLLIESS